MNALLAYNIERKKKLNNFSFKKLSTQNAWQLHLFFTLANVTANVDRYQIWLEWQFNGIIKTLISRIHIGICNIGKKISNKKAYTLYLYVCVRVFYNVQMQCKAAEKKYVKEVKIKPRRKFIDCIWILNIQRWRSN